MLHSISIFQLRTCHPLLPILLPHPPNREQYQRQDNRDDKVHPQIMRIGYVAAMRVGIIREEVHA